MRAVLPVLLLLQLGTVSAAPPPLSPKDVALKEAIDSVNNGGSPYEAAAKLKVKYSRLKWYLNNKKAPGHLHDPIDSSVSTAVQSDDSSDVQKDSIADSIASAQNSAPLPSGGDGRISLCGMAKNEGRYIKEWLNFHKCAGFDHFYILEDKSTDTTRKVLEHYQDQGLVTIVERDTIDALHPQKAFYIECMGMATKQQDKWTAFIDVDEFLFPTAGGSIRDALSKLDQFSQVSVPWSTFGTSGFKTYQPGFVTKSHVMKNDVRDRIYKSIVKPTKVVSDFAAAKNREWNHVDGTKRFKKGELVHGFQVDGLRATEDGTPFEDHECCYYYPERLEPSNNMLQLNHYRFKSVQEAEEKLARTNANSKGTGANKFAKKGGHWTDWDTNIEHDDSAYSLYEQCLLDEHSKKIPDLEDDNEEVKEESVASQEKNFRTLEKEEKKEWGSPREESMKEAPSFKDSIESVLEQQVRPKSAGRHIQDASDLELDDLQWYLSQQEALEEAFDHYD